MSVYLKDHQQSLLLNTINKEGHIALWVHKLPRSFFLTKLQTEESGLIYEEDERC